MQITIEFKTVEGLKVELRDLLSGLSATEKAKAKKAVDKVVDEATEVAAEATAYAEQKAITTEPDEPVVADAGNYEAAKAAILDVSKKQGREAALTILGQFGVSKLPDLDPMHYAALTQAAVEALQS